MFSQVSSSAPYVVLDLGNACSHACTPQLSLSPADLILVEIGKGSTCLRNAGEQNTTFTLTWLKPLPEKGSVL